MRRVGRSCLVFSFGLFGGALGAESLDGGTAIRVEVADGGDTTLEVTRGALRVRAGGEESQVTAGEGAHASPGEKLKHHSLLPAPTGLQPNSGARRSSTEIALTWRSVSGASGYHVTVASDEKFEHAVFESAREAGARTLARVRASGVYYWRVASLRGDLESRPSVTYSFVVDTTPPKLKTGKPTWR